MECEGQGSEVREPIAQSLEVEVRVLSHRTPPRPQVHDEQWVYKPAPLDLSHVRLTPAQTMLVDRLAENGHNVWARDRVAQGWTYSSVQDIPARRNPRLVPYRLLDEATKRSNRDSLCQAVRTLLGYGYNIEPPDQEPSEC